MTKPELISALIDCGFDINPVVHSTPKRRYAGVELTNGNCRVIMAAWRFNNLPAVPFVKAMDGGRTLFYTQWDYEKILKIAKDELTKN